MYSILRQFVSYVTYPLRTLLTAPMWVFAAPGKIMGATVPVRMGIFAGLFLVLCVALRIVYVWQTEPKDLEQFKAVWWIAAVAVLIPVCSVAVGIMVRYWLMSVPSRFPEIDAAWDDGVKQLEAERLFLDEYPLFVVIGLNRPADIEAFMNSSGREWIVRPEKTRRTPLEWWATDEEIFLVLTDCCQSSILKGSGGAVAGSAKPVTNPVQTITGPATATVAPEDSGVPDPTDSGASSTGLGSFAGGHQAAPAFYSMMGSPSSSPSSDAPKAMHTVSGWSESSSTLQPSSAPTPVKPDSSAAKLATDKLAHVCRRLKIARQPYAPLNGIVSVTPFHLLGGRESLAKPLGRAIHQDLATLQTYLGIRAHTICAVAVLDGQEDYWELIKRIREVKQKDVEHGRFGKGVEAWAPVTAANLENVALATCHAFEDYLYRLLASTESLKSIHNGRLYRLLCRMRGDFLGALQDLLVEGFSGDESSGNGGQADTPPMPFAGCYVLGCDRGDVADDRSQTSAFSRGVFDKLSDLNEELEWTEAALTEERFYYAVATAEFGLSIMALAAALVLVAVKFSPQFLESP